MTMIDGLEITAWTYDTPNPNGTWNGNLSWHKPKPIGTAHTTPLYTRETVEKALRDLHDENFALKQFAKPDARRFESEVLAEAIHYPQCWDTAAYPTLTSALQEIYAWFKCRNDGREPEGD